MEFEKLDPKDIRKVAKTAIAYKETFAGPPWNEVSKGPVCGDLYSSQVGENCPCGCGVLKEAYPLIKTTRYVRREISKPEAIAKVAQEDEQVIAFGWGYKETGKEFANTKYKGDEADIEKVAKIIGPDSEFFYMSEFGVIPEKQKSPEKIGSKITIDVAEEAIRRGDSLLLRTMKSTVEVPSRMDGIANKKLGMEPIMGGENQVKDPKNPKRILYYKE